MEMISPSYFSQRNQGGKRESKDEHSCSGGVPNLYVALHIPHITQRSKGQSCGAHVHRLLKLV